MTDYLSDQLRNASDDRFHRIREITSFADFKDPRAVRALCVPGGYALSMYYTSDLADHAEHVRRIFQENPISYYGVCAGGIVASSSCSVRGIEDPIELLGIYPGKTIAPIFPKGKEESAFKLVKLWEKKRVIPTPYIEGPSFWNDKQSEVEVLAKYEESGDFGLSKRVVGPIESLVLRTSQQAAVVLTGCHREFNSRNIDNETFRSTFNLSLAAHRDLINSMQPDDEFRESVLRGHFEKLGIRLKNAGITEIGT